MRQNITEHTRTMTSTNASTDVPMMIGKMLTVELSCGMSGPGLVAAGDVVGTLGRGDV